MVGNLNVDVMANLQDLEQMAYSSLTDYFKILSRQGWVKQASVNRMLVLLFAVQFWWKYSLLMEGEDVRALQRLFNCLGLDCLIPSMHSLLHDKVVINKRSLDSHIAVLVNEDGTSILLSEDEAYLIPETV
jgi:hypothetical protein